jgi:precorrin-6B methylase 1
VTKIATEMLQNGSNVMGVKYHIESIRTLDERKVVYEWVAKAEAGKQINIQTQEYTWGLDNLHKGYLVKTGDDQYNGWRGLFYSYDEPPHEIKEFTTTLRGVYDILHTAFYFSAIVTVEGE